MILFMLEAKDKLRKKFPIIMMICAIVITLIFVREGYHSCDLDSLMFVQRMALFGFIVISLLSIEFFQEIQKKDWKELLYTMKGGMQKFCIRRIQILLVFVGIWLAFATWVCVVYTWPFWQMTPDVRICIVKALILNFALFPIVGMFLGIFVNVFFRKFTGYIVFLIFVTIYIGAFEKFNVSLYRSSNGLINLDIFARFFSLTQPNMDWVVDTVYLIPVELYRFFLYFGWILLFGGLIFLKLLFKKKRIICPVLLWIVSIVCFSQVINPGGISNFNSNEGNGTGVGSFQEFTFQSDEYKEIQEISNDVISYEIHLRIRKELKAEVSMQVIPNKDTYLFTLYRGYELNTVTDQNGNPLEYVRNGDYITVSSGDNVSTINMEYKGHSGAFFSNRRLTVLPVGFAWYPQSGHRPVYSEQRGGYNTDMHGYEPVHIQLTVDSKKTCFSNLQGTDNAFEGVAIGCTLVAGSFVETEQNGLRIIYPSEEALLTEYVSEFLKGVESIESYLQRDMVDEKALQTLILLPVGFQMTTASDTVFCGNDHILDDDLYSPTQCAIGYVRGTIPVSGRLDTLWYDMLEDAIQNQNGKQVGYRILSKESFFTEDEDLMLSTRYQFNMYKTLQSMGDEIEVTHRILDYMREDLDSENWRAFMGQYYLELEEACQ